MTLSICTWKQVKHWKNTITLFEHSQKVVKDNEIAHIKLELAYKNIGETDKAILHFMEAIRIHPLFLKAPYELGYLLTIQGKFDEALNHFSIATPYIFKKLDNAFFHSQESN